MESSIIEKELKELIKIGINPINTTSIEYIPKSKKKKTKMKSQEVKKLEEFKSKVIKDVKPIQGILNTKLWNRQEEKSGILQHQTDSHRAYMFDHKLVKFNQTAGRVEIYLGKLPKVNYFNYLKGGSDLANKTKEECNCQNYDEIQKCKYCNKIQNTIASRSIGKKYEMLKLPLWNTTFTGGALRSENRVYYGTYNVRMKTRLRAKCVSFLTFSMLLPKKDPKFPDSGFWEEIALGFSEDKRNVLSLFLKSESSPLKKKEIIIPIEIKKKDFNRSEYNSYTLNWNPDNITLSVNGEKVYKTNDLQPIPRLPGYTYFIIRPNYDTNNLHLIKNIKKDETPNIHIKSFSYIPDNI